ncbi:Cobalt-precorrin-2 C20-methyltransferase (EC [Lentimonas sp. CC4]|nr:Cobalt-precorrin-2 C20-methyltransferase (EC [Lentimonas sp. CC4]CAA6687165.1 Cobalt-precorrin-2 C20-methyltransferase (EC [Lentimonas sp. CC6]CAA7075488.1 Cobalt-precorrin-2 C20-methyltransferase (EC [Lentimonas sp. CC4]CAA7170255.1 Cobalt-precorrin-2 C20-methyltransferase (EC [Lentimonas sp. CC21]CAA7182549.1 Cobalt-precorrin-2 C20-methyltransferase (EC [Lentimonas sp. CC8]
MRLKHWTLQNMSHNSATPTQGKLTGLGIGPGAKRYLTLEAVDALREADILLDIASPRSSESISARVIDDLGGCEGERVHLTTPMSLDKDRRQTYWSEQAEKVIDWLGAGKKIAFVTLGDPLIYSTFGYLRRATLTLNPEADVRVIPGITSFQAAAAKTGETLLENDESLVLMPASASLETRHALAAAADTVVVLKASKNKAQLFEEINAPLEAESFLYASKLDQAGEAVSDCPEAAAALPDTYLSLFISRRRNHDAPVSTQ